MSINNNKIITQWLGDCWHELADQRDVPNRFVSFTCIHCGFHLLDDIRNEANINYLTENGFFKLLTGLKKKDITWVIDNDGSGYFITLYYKREELLSLFNPNLQKGFVEIVLKLIE